jgi:serine/threonine protein phosphatase PrpC/CRP-like cAMP-binding protein
MKAYGYAQSDPGLKRKGNEDFFLMDEELGLFIVCDGVGGHVAGGTASEMAGRTIRQIVSDGRTILQKYSLDRSLKNRAIVAGLLQKAIQTANEQIYRMAEIDVVKRGMCTTVAALVVLDDYAILAHAGDSRIYLYRSSQVHQLTEDHKYAIEMVKRGMMKPEDAAKSPQANVLTRAVGIQPAVQIDTLQLELANGDTFLLCSDGLHNYADRAELKNRFTGGNPDQLPLQLVEFAKSRGGADNITVVCVKCEMEKTAKDDVVDALKKTEIFGKIPMFRYLGYTEMTKVLAIAHLKKFPQGSAVVKQGDPSDEMYIIASGDADVLKNNVKVAERKKGDFFGEMGIFDNAPRSATVAARTDVVAITLHRKDLLELLRQESQVAVKLLWALNRELNERIRKATDDVANRGGAPTKSGEPTDVINLPFTYSDTK